MSIPESMKQITEAAEKLIAPDDIQTCCILSEEQLKKQGQRIIFQNDAPDKTELVLGDEFEIKVEDGKTFVVRKQPPYPKTYEECCKVLEIQSGWHLTLELNSPAESDLCVSKEFDYVCKLEAFRKILICRDAYWKLAGDWKPDWTDDTFKHYICYSEGKIICSLSCFTKIGSFILAFQTIEIRDTFYENFKDLIEECKELL